MSMMIVFMAAVAAWLIGTGGRTGLLETMSAGLAAMVAVRVISILM